MRDSGSEPFADIRTLEGGFSIPELKWRELLFTGALRADGDGYIRDPRRPFAEFLVPGLLPEGQRFRATREGGRIVLRPEAPGPRV